MAHQTPSLTNNRFSVNKDEVDLTKEVANLRINEDLGPSEASLRSKPVFADVYLGKKGNDVPLPWTTLEASSFPQEYITNLYKAGIEKPTPIQAQSWPLAMQGRDIIAVAKSGSGRKLGFLIPGFIHAKRLPKYPNRDPTVLVLCPTDVITAKVLIEAINFGEPSGIKIKGLDGLVLKGQQKLEGEPDVVVMTMRRLVDHLDIVKNRLKCVEYLVLYEADLLLKASVEPEIQKILRYLPSKHRQTLVFSTTWPREARDIASILLCDPVMISVGITTESVEPESVKHLESLFGASNALIPRELMTPAKKKLLVLDINGILADVVMLDSRYLQQEHIMIRGKSVFKRPFCTDFLQFCFTNFEVGIWSSRNKNNLQKAINYVLGDLKNMLLFCWDQSKCTIPNLKSKENQDKPVFFKELQKLWDNQEPGLPWKRGRFTKANTLLVDDSPYKALLNPLFTAIFPNPYSFKNKEDKSLGVGGALRMYLELVATAEDVQCFVKDNPFGQPAITESHPDWKYYFRPCKP
ncbi:ATP-dependent RNA helicase dbp2-like isoform X2 [Carex rostrata]